jgi:hypothetical protein
MPAHLAASTCTSVYTATLRVELMRISGRPAAFRACTAAEFAIKPWLFVENVFARALTSLSRIVILMRIRHTGVSMKQICMMTLFCLMFIVGTLRATTNYVAPLGLHVPPFLSWLTAATNIQAAIDAATAGNVVLVSNGTYVGPPIEVSDAMMSITSAITVAGLGGPNATIVDAGGYHRRCVYLRHPDAVVRDLTLTLGYARTNMEPQVFPVACGGGVFIDGSGTIENCILRFNRAGLSGGNAYLNGGGTLRGCLIIDGRAPACGGVYCNGGGSIESCTIANNQSTETNLPGGVWCRNGGTLVNTIVYANSNLVNTAVDIHTDGPGWSIVYSRVPSNIVGVGNVSVDPKFRDSAGGDFRLLAGSPCEDAGTNLPWMLTAFDLDGNPRIQRGHADMGAFETPGVYYVANDGAHISPFTSWAHAATNIQAAIDAAYAGTEVIVSDGTYRLSATLTLMTNVSVRSRMGRFVTTLVGGARRILSVNHPDAIFDGFTLTGAAPTNDNGGGVFIKSGIVRNCLLYGNRSPMLGGAVHFDSGGLVENSLLIENAADWGGGAVSFFGGGVLRNCLVAGNRTSAEPVPLAEGARFGGGGVIGISGGEVVNCTIVNNHSDLDGGGICETPLFGAVTTRVQNSIVYYNTAVSNGVNAIGPLLSWDHSCTVPGVPGPGNLDDDPRFVAHEFNQCHLAATSPCVDAATNAAWMTGASDADGNPRLQGVRPDMGAYEQSVRYVATNGLHVSPFSDWATAATNLADVVPTAAPGSMILVGPGCYDAGMVLRVATQYWSVLASAAGAAQTTLSGGGTHRIMSINAPGFLLDGFTIVDGLSADAAGGLNVTTGIVQNCVIVSNRAGQLGGGLALESGAVASRCVIACNHADWAGGGIMLMPPSEVRTCLIVSNSTAALQMPPMFGGQRLGAGGVFAFGGSVIRNCTIADNHSDNDAGGIYTLDFFGTGGTDIVENTILHGNIAVSNGNNYFGGPYRFVYSCTTPAIPAGSDGGGNLVADPLWASDYLLTEASPCRDAGTNMAWMVYANDLAGDPRIIGAVVDMGAYEFVPEPGTVLLLGVLLMAACARRMV